MALFHLAYARTHAKLNELEVSSFNFFFFELDKTGVTTAVHLIRQLLQSPAGVTVLGMSSPVHQMTLKVADRIALKVTLIPALAALASC